MKSPGGKTLGVTGEKGCQGEGFISCQRNVYQLLIVFSCSFVASEHFYLGTMALASDPANPLSL